MYGQSKGRRGSAEAYGVWTARLNRFTNAKTAKQRDAVLDLSLKINPGGTLRDLLQAWGYSASARGRKAKNAQENGSSRPSRERIEQTLDDLFGKKPTPIPSLNPKLAGRTDITVKDACRLVAALLLSWPEPLQALESVDGKDRQRKAQDLAELFIRELLSELSAGRSREWSAADMEIRVFRLVNEERVSASHFIQEAGGEEGALIVAGRRNILIGQHPVDTVREFHRVTSKFISEGKGGILIFVFDAAILEARKNGIYLLDNIGLLSTALMAFALFPEDFDSGAAIQQHEIDWSRWRNLSRQCCVVIRKPPLIDTSSGALLNRNKFDEFVAAWHPGQNFETLRDLEGFIRFDSSHVLPRKYPDQFNDQEILSNLDLYWDVIVRPSNREPEGLEVRYYIPPPQAVSATTKAQQRRDYDLSLNLSQRGRPSSKTIPVEEDLYVIRKSSPGGYYDDAQRAIYMAARGRLNLDFGDQHVRNLNAAAALRQVGYEVWPISILLSFFPTMLHFAAMERESQKTTIQP